MGTIFCKRQRSVLERLCEGGVKARGEVQRCAGWGGEQRRASCAPCAQRMEGAVPVAPCCSVLQPNSCKPDGDIGDECFEGSGLSCPKSIALGLEAVLELPRWR